MDLLRWILLGLGLLLITAVWWHGRRNRPAHEESLFASARRRWRERTTAATTDEERDPADLDLPEREDPDFGFDPAELDELFDRGRESTEAPVGRQQAAQRAASSTGARPSAGGARRAEPAPRGEVPRGDTPASPTPTPPTQRGGPNDKIEADAEEAFEGPAANREPRTEPEPDRASVQDQAPAPRGAGDASQAGASQDARAPDNVPRDTSGDVSADARGPADRSAGESPAPQDPVDRSHDRAASSRQPARDSNATAGRRRGAEHEFADGSDETDERIVVLYVVAPKGERLNGTSLYRAFTELGLEHGELEIFHGHDESGHKVYSVANATEPGTFDPATMADLQTPGIALFARLPGPQSPTRTFDAMATTARRLAEMLGARALDERQSTLTRQTEQAMRDELLEYEHRRARLRR